MASSFTMARYYTTNNLTREDHSQGTNTWPAKKPKLTGVGEPAREGAGVPKRLRGLLHYLSFVDYL